MHLLHEKEMYGVVIIEALEGMGLSITDGTLYPLLARMTRENILEAKWVTQDNKGHPRKYYRLTDSGKQMLAMMKKEWHILTHAIEEQTE